jgi:hypothetical protein
MASVDTAWQSQQLGFQTAVAMARMLGNSGGRPTVYGHGTGETKKCFGCWDGCGYQPDKQTQRTREKRETAKLLDEYESPDSAQCPLDGLRCTCNRDPIECDPWRTRATGLPEHEGVYRHG